MLSETREKSDVLGRLACMEISSVCLRMLECKGSVRRENSLGREGLGLLAALEHRAFLLSPQSECPGRIESDDDVERRGSLGRHGERTSLFSTSATVMYFQDIEYTHQRVQRFRYYDASFAHYLARGN